MTRRRHEVLSLLLLSTIVFFAPAAVVVPETAECYTFSGLVVDGATGQPAPDAEVTWCDKNGEVYPIWLDDEACFVSLMGMATGWYSAAYARRGDAISQLVPPLTVGERDGVFVLGKGAELSGRVVDERGVPVAGAVVGVAPCLTNGVGLFEGISNDNGYYRIEGAAPGGYNVVLEHPDYYAIIRKQWPDANVELAAGGAMAFNITVKAKQVVTGTVLGPDGEPAANVAISRGHYEEAFGVTDADGRFSIHSQGEKFTFERALLGRAVLNVNSDEIAVEGVTVRLPGTARFTGRIFGTAGEIVPFASVEGRRADALGNFDTGWISLPEKGGPVTLRAGSQSTWEEVLIPLNTQRESADSPSYHPTEIEMSVAQGEEHTVNIQLEPVPFWVARGTVRDAAGHPVADAVVAIYEGDVNAHQWMNDMAPRIPVPPERYPWRPRQSVEPGTPPARRLARVRSEADGSWVARILRLPNPDHDWLGRKPDPHRLSIVAADASLTRTSISRHPLSDQAPDSFDVELELCPIENELTSFLLLDGPDGRPLADLSWSVNCFGPYKSDTLGMLRIPRFSGVLELSLLTPGMQIKDAQFHGDYAMPPLPKSDIEREDKSIDYDSALTMGFIRMRSPEGLHADPALPNLCRGERTLSFRYFDPARGNLHVTLEPSPH